MTQKSNVVFISRQRVVGATNGSSAYLLDLAQAVRDAGLVPHLIQPSPSIIGRTPIIKMRPEMDVFASHQVRGLLRIGRRYVSLSPRVYAALARAALAAIARRIGILAPWTADRPLPYSVSIPWTAADHGWLRGACRGKADVAIADYMFCAEGFQDLPSAAVPTAIVMHDLFHARAGEGQDSVALVDRDHEISMLTKADAVIAIQVTEESFIKDHVPGSRALLAPMAANPVEMAQPGENGRLLFVGSHTAPNSVGLQWFFDLVWPLVRAEWPSAMLDIAGSVIRAFPEGGPSGVTFLGFVDDLAAHYAASEIVISPLTFGSGLKIKFVEALANGKAVVATSITMQGVPQECEDAVRVSDDPAEFARHIVALHSDTVGRKTLAETALAMARAYYSANSCFAEFKAWLQESAAKAGRS